MKKALYLGVVSAEAPPLISAAGGDRGRAQLRGGGRVRLGGGCVLVPPARRPRDRAQEAGHGQSVAARGRRRTFSGRRRA